MPANVSLLTCNVLMDNTNFNACIELIKTQNPDIVLLVEVNKAWVNNLSALKAEYSYEVSYPLENTFGMLLLSKYALSDCDIHFLTDESIPSIHTKVTLSDGKTFQLFCLHPSPPAPPMVDYTNNDSAQRDAELLIVAKKCKAMTQPIIVIGDLNDVAWSKSTALFQSISGLLDPRRGRGLYNSFHANHWFLRFSLDHVFHSKHFQLVELNKLHYIGSDHFPISIKLNL